MIIVERFADCSILINTEKRWFDVNLVYPKLCDILFVSIEICKYN